MRVVNGAFKRTALKRTLEATEEADVPSVLRKLRGEAMRANLPDFAVDSLDAQLRDALESLVSRGKELRALGSRLHLERKLEGPGYSVKLIFRVGERPSLAERIARRLRMR